MLDFLTKIALMLTIISGVTKGYIKLEIGVVLLILVFCLFVGRWSIFVRILGVFATVYVFVKEYNISNSNDLISIVSYLIALLIMLYAIRIMFYGFFRKK